MQFEFSTVSTVIQGDRHTRVLCDWLMAKSQWFAYEPLPDDQYRVHVKEENLWLISTFTKAVSAGLVDAMISM